MSNDINCPVCGEDQEINHDDGFGYSEDEMHHQQCCSCGSLFGFQTSISFHYTAFSLPCLNGEEHTFKPTFTVPVEYTKMYCQCGEVRKPTSEEMSQILASRGYVCS